ncbi:MAG TPA: glycosyltransferase family 4 protein [Candidatus Tyrphobacter sp.]
MRDARKPRALIITQFFAPEPCAAAHRMEAMTKALHDRGLDVTVLAPMPSFPSGRIDAAYRGKFFLREDRDGAEVIRLLHIATARRYGRYLAWLSFAALATVYAVLFAKKADVVIMTSPPITLAFPAIAVRLLRGSRLVVDVRDVFPDLPIQMGEWSENGLMARLVGGLVNRLYALASLITPVTPNAVERVRTRAGDTEVLLAPNGWDRVEAHKGVIKRRNGEFVATFTGNFGLANGLDLLLDAAKLVARDEIRIALIGGGADCSHVVARIQNERIDNVDYYGVRSRAEAMGALAESDAAVSVLREGITECIPTKLFDAFAVERPVVLCASGEARRVVSEAAGGLCSAPGDPESLADALRRLAGDRNLANALGVSGRRYAAAFDREVIMAVLAERIARILEAHD